MDYLSHLKGDQEFVWIHILPPHAPYNRRDPFLDRLDEIPPDLPQKVRPLDLEPYADPSVPLPADKEREFRAMYKLNAAYADDLLGRMLAGLKRSGQWDKTLLVVTSDHGEEFKESGQIAHGGNLGHVLVEVPLVVKLPKGFEGELALPPGGRMANLRVASTLIEAAGGTPEPGTAPSLFQSFDKGALSSSTWATASTASRWWTETSSSSGRATSASRSRSISPPASPGSAARPIRP